MAVDAVRLVTTLTGCTGRGGSGSETETTLLLPLLCSLLVVAASFDIRLRRNSSCFSLCFRNRSSLLKSKLLTLDRWITGDGVLKAEDDDVDTISGRATLLGAAEEVEAEAETGTVGIILGGLSSLSVESVGAMILLRAPVLNLALVASGSGSSSCGSI